MTRAGRALRQVLEEYGISQNRLAVVMGAGRSTVHYWFSGSQDPKAEAVLEIVDALEQLNPEASQAFLEMYLGRRSIARSAVVAEPVGAADAVGAALRQVLGALGISKNQFAIAMGVDRATVGGWFSGAIEPMANAVPLMVDALGRLNPAAARLFLEAYLGRSLEDLIPDRDEAARLARLLERRRASLAQFLATTDDPNARAVSKAIATLQELDPIAAIAFIEAYLGRSLLERDRGD
jgi:transcriptional regulator with XRE-family HTH domain